MLKVHIGSIKGSIFHISKVFNSRYEEEWFEKEEVKQMVLDIDKSVVISGRIIDSPFLGPITPRELSTGVKTLILMLCEEELKDMYFDGDFMGDNCVPWLFKISQLKDIKITLTNLMDFDSVEKEEGFEIYIENDGRHIKSDWEFILAHNDFLNREAE